MRSETSSKPGSSQAPKSECTREGWPPGHIHVASLAFPAEPALVASGGGGVMISCRKSFPGGNGWEGGARTEQEGTSELLSKCCGEDAGAGGPSEAVGPSIHPPTWQVPSRGSKTDQTGYAQTALPAPSVCSCCGSINHVLVCRGCWNAMSQRGPPQLWSLGARDRQIWVLVTTRVLACKPPSCRVFR